MTQYMEYSVSEDKHVFVLKGEIDTSNADAFFANVMEKFEGENKDILFDCENLEFIDSTTLGTFVKILKRVSVAGKKMKLKALQPKIKKLFSISKLDTIMEIEE